MSKIVINATRRHGREQFTAIVHDDNSFEIIGSKDGKVIERARISGDNSALLALETPDLTEGVPMTIEGREVSLMMEAPEMNGHVFPFSIGDDFVGTAWVEDPNESNPAGFGWAALLPFAKVVIPVAVVVGLIVYVAEKVFSEDRRPNERRKGRVMILFTGFEFVSEPVDIPSEPKKSEPSKKSDTKSTQPAERDRNAGRSGSNTNERDGRAQPQSDSRIPH